MHVQTCTSKSIYFVTVLPGKASDVHSLATILRAMSELATNIVPQTDVNAHSQAFSKFLLIRNFTVLIIAGSVAL